MKKYAIALLTLSLGTFAFAGPGQQDPPHAYKRPAWS